MTKNNPLPFKDCTESEAVQYLKNHIEQQDAKIDELTNALQTNENARQLRAWAVDLASRNFKDSGASAEDILDLAEKYRVYADVNIKVQA